MTKLGVGRYAAATCLTAVALIAPSDGATAVSTQIDLSSASEPASGASPDDGRWVWPLDPQPTVVRAFEPPAHDWEAGHRGVDLLGEVGQPVGSIGTGTVRFAGVIAGRGVVVVRHGTLRSTYEPVTTAVHVGDVVAAGETIGVLQLVQSHCPPRACLHLGLRRGDQYLDPLSLFGPRDVRLKPLGEESVPGPSTAVPSSASPLPRGGRDGSDRSAEIDSWGPPEGLGPGGRRLWLGSGSGVAALLSMALGWRGAGQLQARG